MKETNTYTDRFLHEPLILKDEGICRGKGKAVFAYDIKDGAYHFGCTIATTADDNSLLEDSIVQVFLPLKKSKTITGIFYGEFYYLRPENKFFMVIHGDEDKYVYLVPTDKAKLYVPPMKTITPLFKFSPIKKGFWAKIFK